MAHRPSSFEVYVSKEDFKFNCAHFVAFEGYRERLHGHNYKVGVRVLGSRKISNDGYVVDFGDIKKVTRKICKSLNERFLCPILSDVLKIEESQLTGDKESVTITCQDGDVFQFPKNDCAMLPIMHSTTEELAIYLWGRILDGLNAQYLIDRGIHTMEVVVAEAVSQEAVFRLEIPEQNDLGPLLDVRAFINEGKLQRLPCSEHLNEFDPSSVAATASKTSTTSPRTSPPVTKEYQPECNCGTHSFSAQLQVLADAMNSNQLKTDNITVQDMLRFLPSTQSEKGNP